MPERVLQLDDAAWERLLELTRGAVAECFQCGVCTAACPWGLVRKEALTVRSLIRRAQLGDGGGDHALWLCTSCAQCEAYCPRGVNITRVIRALRLLAWERRQVEKGLPSVLWSLYWNNNPWSQPPSQRMSWAANMHLPMFDPQNHEVLLYIGCTSSYDRRAQHIAHALVRLLNAAEVSFGVLGEAEPCCGEAALSLGHLHYFKDLARNAMRTFDAYGARRVVTLSPHCGYAFKQAYAEWAEEVTFEVLHYSQYLHELVQAGRLRFRSVGMQRVTFQDPCYLGRRLGEYAAPRAVLHAIPGTNLVEMEVHGVDALCCGGGGGRMWMETPAGERFSDLRIQQARQTQAEMLITACPFCLLCLEDSAKTVKAESLRVLDLAEYACLALDGATEGE